jgi:hypothetical protein
MPGEGAVMNDSTNAPAPEALEGGHVAFERCPVDVRDRPLGARRGHEVHHRAAEVRHLELEKARVPDDVLHRRTPLCPENRSCDAAGT